MRVRLSLAFALLGALVVGGCSGGAVAHGEEHVAEHGSAPGEHGGEGVEGGEESGEESGAEYARDATFDEVRKGARLTLAFDAKTNAFVGTVENTTEKPLEKVRVEVHLSNGIELGPPPAADLVPGEMRDVRLEAGGKSFDKWSAHEEVGSSEHAHGESGEHH